MSTTLTRSSSTTSSSTTSSLEAAATRLALLLTAPGGPVGDWADGPGGMEYEPVVELRPLTRTAASATRVLLAGVTKVSSLSRGGAPRLGQLEVEATDRFGPRALWWAAVARTRADVHVESGAGLQVVVARLDPDARFAFRVDLPADADPEAALGALSALSDDAAFPGYPYPLTVADRLAACPGWLRHEVRLQLDDLFDRAGVPHEVRERAFADRHDLMERA